MPARPDPADPPARGPEVTPAAAPSAPSAGRAAPARSGDALLARLLRKRLRAVRRRLPAVRAGRDLEAVHDLRVALRRLRAALGGLAEFLPRRALRAARKPARRLLRALGAARDADVQIETLAAFLAGLPAGNRAAARLRPGLRRLRLRLRQQRETLQPRVRRELERFDRAGIAAALDDALRRRRIRARRLPARGGAATAARLRRAAFRRLTARLATVLAFEPHVAHPERIAELHCLRIAVRRLRYAVDLFAPLYAGRLAAAAPPLAELQGLLGEIHDADIWLAALPEFLAAERARARIDRGRAGSAARLAPGLEAFAADRRRVRAERYAAFAARWRQTRAAPFWESLARTLDEEGRPARRRAAGAGREAAP